MAMAIVVQIDQYAIARHDADVPSVMESGVCVVAGSDVVATLMLAAPASRYLPAGRSR
jgi:hypothetical protein